MQQQTSWGTFFGAAGLLVLGILIGWQIAPTLSNLSMNDEDDEKTTMEDAMDEVKKTVPSSGGTTKTSTGGTTGTTKTTTSAPKTTSWDGATIRYTDSGFVPAIAEVHAGQAITFVNESSKTMYVKSIAKVMPYLELNEGTSVGRGGKFTFVFTSLGTWGYENANYTDHKGAVAVMPQQ